MGDWYATTAPENKYQYNGIELNSDLGMNWNFAAFRTYDPAIGRWGQIDPEIKYHESLYAWNTNNPILYNDPLGRDSTQRANAIKKAQEYLDQNPGNSYVWGGKGNPGEGVDCSGLVSKCVVAGGENDPNTGNSNGVKNIADNTTEVEEGDLQEGNLVILDNGSNDHGHIGIITEIVLDGNGDIKTLRMVDSGGTEGPRESTLVDDGDKKYWGKRITSYRKWDTKPDKVNSSTSKTSSKKSSRRRSRSSRKSSSSKDRGNQLSKYFMKHIFGIDYD